MAEIDWENGQMSAPEKVTGGGIDWEKGKISGPSNSQNKGTAADLATDLKRGVQQLPGMVTGLLDVPIGLVTGERYAGKAADALGKATGFQPSKWADEARSEYSEGRRKADAEIDKAWEDDKTTGWDVAGAYLSNPGKVAGMVVESLPSMVAGGLAGRGALAAARGIGAVTRPAAGAAGAAQATRQGILAGAGGEGAVMAGQAMDQIDESVDARRAGVAALASGVAGAAFGVAGGNMAQRLGVVDPETLIAGGATAQRQPQGLARRVFGGAIAEGVFEELPQSVQEQMLQNWAEKKDLFEGVPRSAVEGLLAGGAMGGAFNALPGGRGGAASPDTGQPGATPEVTPEQAPQFNPLEVQQQVDMATGVETMRMQDFIKKNIAKNDGGDKRMQEALQEEVEPQVILDEKGRPKTTTSRYEIDLFHAEMDARLAKRQKNIESVERMTAARRPSEEMGIDPAAGSLSAGAAIAVDSGVSGQMQQAALSAQQADISRTTPTEATYGTQTHQAVQAGPQQPQAGAAQAAERLTGPGVTSEAQQLLASVDAGGVPVIVTNNLRRIAAENGVEVTSGMRPNDVVAALRQKAVQPEVPVMNAPQFATAPAGGQASVVDTAPAQTSAPPRPSTWRRNRLAAGKVARDMGIDPAQHDSLASLLGAIDAADAAAQGNSEAVVNQQGDQSNGVVPSERTDAAVAAPGTAQTGAVVGGSAGNTAARADVPAEPGAVSAARGAVVGSRTTQSDGQSGDGRAAVTQAQAKAAKAEQTQGQDAQSLRQRLSEVEDKIIQKAAADYGADANIETAMKSRKVPLPLKAERKRLKDQLAGAEKKIWDGSEPTSAVTGQRPAFATAASASLETESSQGSSNARGQSASTVAPEAEEGKAQDNPKLSAREAQEIGAKNRDAAKKEKRRAERPAAARADTGLSAGRMPNDTVPITVRDGVVYIGDYEALDYETEKPVTVPKGSTRDDVAKALKDAGALGGNQKIFGLNGKEDAAMYNRTQANDKLSSADKAVFGMAAEGKSAREVLNFIHSASRSPFNRQLARLLLKTGIDPKISVGDAKTWKFDAGPGLKYAAAYNPDSNTVALFRPASAERHMLHELVHAATIQALGRKGLPSIQMRALFNHVKKSGKLKGMYGMTNVDEFVAEAFTNPDFQRLLKTVSAPQGSQLKTAWDWLVRIIKDILGLPASQQNALSQALDVGVALMSQDKAIRNAGAGNASGVRHSRDAVDDAEVQRQFKETERAYGGREAYDRAKAAGKTKLNYRQWVQVRTPAFKEWFGDHEIAAATPKRQASTFAEARDHAKEFQGQPLTNSATGIVATVSRNNLDKMLNGKAVGKSENPATHSLAVANLDALFERALLGWSKPDSEGDPNIKAVHRFFSPVMVDGRAMLAKMTVKETAQESRPNSLYTVEAISFEKMESPAAQWVGEIAGADGIDPRTIRSAGLVESLAQRVQDFNPDSVSKVVDPATGEPMVVYHSTNGGFTAFDETKRSDGFGYYFATSPALAKKAAAGKSRVIEAFISAKSVAGSQKIPAANWLEMRYDGKGRELAKEFDAAWVRDEGKASIVVRNPNQIKSATDNTGTFDPTNPDIRYSFAGQNADPMPALSRSDVAQAVAERFPSLARAVNAALRRGDEGKKGGLVVVEHADDLSGTFASKTGRSMDDAVQLLGSDENGQPQGLFDPQSGLTFLVGSALTTESAPAVLLHEAMHGKQREEIDARAMALIEGRARTVVRPTREFLNRVSQRMESAGEAGNQKEAAAYIVEEAVLAGRQAGFSAADGRFLSWVDRSFGKRVGNIVRDMVAMVRAWVLRTGVGIQPSIDDLVALAKLNLNDMVRGDVAGQAGFSTGGIRFSRSAAQKILDAGDAAIAKADGWLDRGTRIPEGWSAEQQAAAGKFATFSPKQPIKSMLRGINNRLKDRATQLIFDQFRPLMKVSKEAFMTAHLSKATDGALEAMANLGIPKLRDGALAVDKQDGGGFLNDLARLLGSAQEANQFLMWVAGNRAEKLKEEGRENLFTPADIDAMKAFSQGKLPDGRLRPVAYAEAHARLNAYNKAVLDIAEQAGLIDGEARKNWESDFYIPFYRVSEESGEMDFSKGGTGLARQKVIQQLKGGTENLGDPLANIMSNWHMMLTASMRNMAANKALTQGEMLGIADKVKAPAQAVPAAKGGTWTMQNGQKVLWQVHDPMVAEALEALNFTGYNNPAMRAAGRFKHMLTMGVTISPTFRIRNLMRDALQAVATADVGYNPMKNAVEGWKLTSKDSDTMAQLMAGGGAVRFGSFNDGQQAESAKRLIAMGVKDNQILNTPDKLKNFFRRFYDSYQETGDRAETINRAVIYQRAIAAGKTHLEASFEARDLMNFTSLGSSAAIRALAQVLPFFNARLQGMDRLVRGAAADPRRFWSVAGVIGMASALLFMLQGDDDEYKALPDYVRDTYWPVKMGGVWAYIPKPFEVGALGTVVERFTELMLAGEDYQVRDFRDTMVGVLGNTLALNPVPQIVKPVGEAWFNYDMFRGQAIDSMAMERLLPQERFNANTSSAAVGIGRALEVSPQKVEHLVRGYFGWLGTQALNVGDLMARPFMDMPASPKSDLTQVNNWLVAGDMFKEVGTTPSKYSERFYQVQREINAIYATASQARNLGNMEQYRELMSRPEMAARPLIANANRQMTQINQRMRAVMADRSMSVVDKNRQLQELRRRRDDIARRVDERARATG